jgi:hypothetical protein
MKFKFPPKPWVQIYYIEAKITLHFLCVQTYVDLKNYYVFQSFSERKDLTLQFVCVGKVDLEWHFLFPRFLSNSKLIFFCKVCGKGQF